MKLTASIVVHESADKVRDCFMPEIGDMSRASFDILETDDNVELRIDAEDPVAMRAAFNSLMKNLTVFKKMEQL